MIILKCIDGVQYTYGQSFLGYLQTCFHTDALYYRKRRQAGLPPEAGYPDQRQGGCPEQKEAKEVKELNRRRSDHHRLCCIMLDCRVTWND